MSTISLLPSSAEGMTPSDDVRHRGTATSDTRVLVIDDDAAEVHFVRRYVQHFEHDHTYEIVAATTISELFDALRRGQPDLILFAAGGIPSARRCQSRSFTPVRQTALACAIHGRRFQSRKT